MAYNISLIQKYLNEPATALQVFALNSITERLKNDFGIRWDEKTRVFLLPEISFTSTTATAYDRDISAGVASLGDGFASRTYVQSWRPYAPNIDDSFDFIIDKLSLSESGWEENLILVLREWARQHKVPNLDRKVIANIFAGSIGSDNAGSAMTVPVRALAAQTIQPGTTKVLSLLNDIDGYLADSKVGDEEEVFIYCSPNFFSAVLGDTDLTKFLSVVENEGKVQTYVRQYNRFTIIRVPTDYLPSKANFVVVPKSAVLYGLKFDIVNIYDSDNVPIRDGSGKAHIALEAVGHIYGFAGVLYTKAHAVITSSYENDVVLTMAVVDDDAAPILTPTIVLKEGAVQGQGATITAESNGTYKVKLGTYNFSVAKTAYATKTGVLSVVGADLAAQAKTVTVELADA